MWAREDDAGARVGWSRGHSCDERLYLLFLLRDGTVAVTTRASRSAVGGGGHGGTAALLGRVAVDVGVWGRGDDARMAGGCLEIGRHGGVAVSELAACVGRHFAKREAFAAERGRKEMVVFAG